MRQECVFSKGRTWQISTRKCEAELIDVSRWRKTCGAISMNGQSRRTWRSPNCYGASRLMHIGDSADERMNAR